MKLTTFIGATWEQICAFHDQEVAEAKKLDEISDHYDARMKARRKHIDHLQAELRRLEAKDDYERKIWHNAMAKSTAYYERLNVMWDELNAARTQESA